MENKLEKEIIKLQETVSYQTTEINNLSDELYIQQKELAELKKTVKMLKSSLDNIQNAQEFKPLSQETPPPHY